jgi:hypothetical protein
VDVPDAGGRVRRVKLMADYGAFPLWAVPDEAPWPRAGDHFWTSARRPDDVSPATVEVWAGELTPTDLPLSASLIAALQHWADEHDRLLGPTFDWPSDDAKATFVADGRRLLDLVRAELGPGYEVAYFDEITGRLEQHHRRVRSNRTSQG